MRRVVATLTAMLVLAVACTPAAPAPDVPAAKPAAPPAAPVPEPAVPPAAQPAEKQPEAEPDGWEALVEAAKREGQVTVLGPPGATPRTAIVDEFQRAFDIRVEFNAGRLGEFWPRIEAERAADAYLWDVLIGGGSTVPQTLKPAGGTRTLLPEILLTDILDESNWLNNQLWWVDAEEPYTTLNFQGNVQLIVAFNTDLVTDPGQFTSYMDLLDPQWRGRIVMTDLRNTPVGGVPSTFLYQHPDLGPEFIERLFFETEPTLSVDQSQMVDWLAQGQFALGVFLSPQNMITAMDQGLPVDYVPGEQFREGGVIGPSVGTVTLFDQGPHPNAAKLLLNWLLSQEGQLAWQQHVQAPSLRTDVPKDDVFPLFVPQPGFEYENGGHEHFRTRERIDGTNAAINNALQRRGQ